MCNASIDSLSGPRAPLGVRQACALLLLALLTAAPCAQALVLRVGSDVACTHSSLQAALNALQNQPGLHSVLINKGTYAVPDGMVYTPSVVQTGVLLESGYDTCSSGLSGDPTLDADRAVFNGSGGSPRSVLDLRLNGRVGTFQMRRIVLTGGDAVGSGVNAYGGGLAIRGGSSVLLGRGLSIRSNSAIDGGGVVLTGSLVTVSEPLARVDLFLTEGAEIVSNTASGMGGGLYCGGIPPAGGVGTSRHGSIIASDTVIGFNQAGSGAAFHCFGSLEGGGGLQPRPSAAGLVWIVGNQSSAETGGCAAGTGTLDASQPATAGVRVLGAADDSPALLAVSSNTGFNPGLCLSGSYRLGTSTRPLGESRFRLQNLVVAQQAGRGVLGLSASNGIDLEIRPSGNAVSCSFFNSVPCVSLHNNAPDTGSTGRLAGASSGARLRLQRASVRDNQATQNMFAAVDADSRLQLVASILDDNSVTDASGVAGRSLFYSAFGGTVLLLNTTAILRSGLDRFFRLDDAGTAAAYASILASTVSPAPANIGGNDTTARFTRGWCGFYQSTADFAAHVVDPDPTLGSFTTLPPSAFDLDPQTYAPRSPQLIDRCSITTNSRDFHGESFHLQTRPGSMAFTDIGAVEVQPQIDVFADGFEDL
ncbi:hypothetical protein [Aquimonas sp.]|jgi:hypothetical protein|uniref:hypothetical protein n=1 Tax=Aquimonas sp. TaxID=1872588 RepID=UPI0037C035D1